MHYENETHETQIESLTPPIIRIRMKEPICYSVVFQADGNLGLGELHDEIFPIPSVAFMNQTQSSGFIRMITERSTTDSGLQSQSDFIAYAVQCGNVTFEFQFVPFTESHEPIFTLKLEY